MSNQVFIADAKDYPVVGDYRKTFKKTKEDKELLMVLKHVWKTGMKKFYGANWKKEHNVPNTVLQD